MRALLHPLRSNAHSQNVKQSSHLGQNTKLAKNATTWRQQQQALHTEEAERQKGEEEEHRGSCRQVHLQETAEKGRAGDQNITYIVIDRDHKKSSEEDKVSINSFYSRRSDIHSDEQCPCGILG